MKIKPFLLVVITIILGFILGMLTSAQIRYNKLKPVRLYFSEDHFREGFYKAIQPDEKQKAEIRKILDKYAKLNSDLQGNFRKELDSNMKEFRKELESKLTDEQLSRLKEIDRKRQDMIRKSRRNHSDDSLNSKDFRRGDHYRRYGDGGRHFIKSRHMPSSGSSKIPQADTTGLTDKK